MTKTDLEQQSLPKDLPALAVLGLREPPEGDWARLRKLQFADLSKVTVARIAAHGAAAVVTAAFFIGKVSVFALFAWLCAVTAALYYSARNDAMLSNSERRGVGNEEINGQARSAMLISVTWVFPFAVLAHFADLPTLLKVWSVVGLLMTYSAIALAPVPLGSVMFVGVVGLAAAFAFIFAGAIEMALLAAIYCTAIISGIITNARNFLTARIGEVGVAEKSEVVSLLLREFEENEADWLWQLDPSRRVRSVSKRFAAALGLKPEEIDGVSFVQLISGSAWETGHFPPSLHDLNERLKRLESFSNLLVRVSINGEQRWWELSGTPKYNAHGGFDGFRGVGSDVTEQRESVDKMSRMARYDTLTGLPNRMMLTEAMGEAMRYAEQWRTRCAFLMIDLDRFKAVNDTLGHLVGDQLLAQVSERLRQQMTDNELCGRLGGDEFAIVIRDASDANYIRAVAERVIERLSQPYTVDQHTLYVGASVGSAIGPRDGTTVETLMHNADLALYRSKDIGGGVYCTFEPALHAQAEARRRLETALRLGLEKNEFRIEYQPVIDTVSERLVGFEALLRWTNEEHGAVEPEKFIQLAVDTRQIVPIGAWVFQQACREAAQWPSNVKLSVNVAVEQLVDPNFISMIVEALSNSGLSPKQLEIEVTEGAFQRDAAQSKANLDKVIALGCAVVLDDFGSGAASLGTLRVVRFSSVKFERGFARDAAVGKAESIAVIRAAVAMGDSLEFATVAKGVETDEELATARQLGIKRIQGFYYGRAMTSAAVSAIFQKNPQTQATGTSG